MKAANYVLVSPARNEEAYIGRTIEAVVSQTIGPRAWVIVSDGSVDRTDEIVASYAQRHDFIRLIRRPADGRKPNQKDFGAKVRAFRAGYDELGSTPHEFVGNLDADITMAPRYFEQILERFDANPRLGLAGGIVCEPGKGGFAPQHISLNSVCGSVQLFRRECYESFGGYVPLRLGGVDAAAEIKCRRHGWEVRTFPDIEVRAQRRVLTGRSTVLHTRYGQGFSNYLLGYHPVFQVASCLSRIGEEPYLVGSMAALLGFVVPWIRRDARALPDDVVRFLRAEQMRRIRCSLTLRRALEQ